MGYSKSAQLLKTKLECLPILKYMYFEYLEKK